MYVYVIVNIISVAIKEKKKKKVFNQDSNQIHTIRAKRRNT